VFREDEALEVAQEFAKKHQLEMTLLGVKREEEVTTFFFSAPERVNFRDLARDLQSIFQTEIRFEEAGPREKARRVGGLGRCGRPLCCNAWLSRIPHVSLETLERAPFPTLPEKYTGACGRPMCCLLYENKPELSKPKPTKKEKKEENHKSEKKPRKTRKKRVRRLRL